MTIIRQLFFTFLVLLFAAGQHVSAAEAVKLHGRVTVDGKPRQGVVVSDGVNVVATDSKGNYSMPSVDRQHVFISVPADCRIPLSDPGLPCIYKEIGGKPGKKVRRDFALESAPKADKWTLLAFADVQIGFKKDLADLDSKVMPKILNVTDTLTQPVYGISLGDIVWNNPDLYGDYCQQMARMGVPVFPVIGNHDHNEKSRGDIVSDLEFRNALGPTYYSANVGDCHIIALDNIIYSAEKGRNDYRLGITDQQIEWLKKDLAFVDKSKALIIGMHSPTERRPVQNYDKQHGTAKAKPIYNQDKLLELVKDYANVQLLAGHMHYNFINNIAPNITETSFGAVNGAFWYPLCNDGSPQGFGVLRFDGNRLADKYYQGLGCSRDYQLKVYHPSDAVLHNPEAKPGDKTDKVLINVFFWDKDWTIEVFEDNKDMYTIVPDRDRARIPAYDPDVVKQLNPKTGWLDANHKGSRPTGNNDHLFLYKPSEGWKTITVCATDPFGRKYVAAVGHDGSKVNE